MEISADVLRQNTLSWPQPDKKALEKRILGRQSVNVLDVYKLFMPGHFKRILFSNGYADLANKWQSLKHDNEVLEKTRDDFSHDLYVGLEDKALKAVLT